MTTSPDAIRKLGVGKRWQKKKPLRWKGLHSDRLPPVQGGGSRGPNNDVIHLTLQQWG